MNRAAFEQLVCEWLDARHDLELRARIDAARAADPALEPLLAEWQRFDVLLRRGLPAPRGVDWPAMHDRIVAGATGSGCRPVSHERAPDVPSAARDAALDTALADFSDLDRRVDWPRFQARVAGAVGTAAAGLRRQRWRRRGLMAIAGGLAAAAALILAVLPGETPPATPRGLVQVVVAPPRAETIDAEVGLIDVRLAVIEPTSAPPQCLLLVDPLVSSTPSRGTADVF